MNVNIVDFGASVTLADNAAAIAAAIAACHESGGGCVTVPAGRFVTGTVYLKDNIELHLEAGAVLKASADMSLYNPLEAYPQNFGSQKEGWDFRHLIIAHDVQNVSLTGPGIIEGCAEADWWGNVSVFSHFVWRDGIRRTKDMKKGNTRPGQLLAFVESKDIRITDVTIQGTTSWTCLLHGCERVQIRGVKIFNGRQDANTDGFDIDSCRYVTVSDCIINTGDDLRAEWSGEEKIVSCT